MGKILEQDGFRMLGAHEVAPEILVPEGTLGRVAATPARPRRYRARLRLSARRGPFDIGQAVVVAGKHVLAVEAAEGTDRCWRALPKCAPTAACARPPAAACW